MHLLLELITGLFFVACWTHAVKVRGSAGGRLMVAMLTLGFVRETFVVYRKILYGYAELNLMVGLAPMIAAIIWGYSIYLAICWAESATGRRLEDLHRRPGALPFLLGVGLFMICLVGFYEPFLERVGMARWEEGTLRAGGVPLIALVGYPTLALPFVWIWTRMEYGSQRLIGGPKKWAIQQLPAILLALLHAGLLQILKDFLRW